MCKLAEHAIKRNQVQLWSWRPIGSRIDCSNHFIRGVIVAKTITPEGVIIAVQNDWSDYMATFPHSRYTRIWWAQRGPCGIIYPKQDAECDEVVDRYHRTFEAQAMNAMAL